MLHKRTLFVWILQVLVGTVLAAKVVQSSDGVKIWANAVGSSQNQALVLVHGIGGSASGWGDIIQDQRLLSKFYVVIYDLRGHGRSDKPTTADGYTSKLFANDFAAVSKAYNLKSPVVLGWSYGGTVFTDIFSYLPSGSVSALVGVAALPFTNIPNINTPNALTFVPGLFVADSVQTNIKSRIAVVDNTYNDPSTVPYETKRMALGAAVIQPPLVSLLLLTRPQDPSALFAAGRKGLPLLMIYGTNDKILQNEVILNVTAPNFSKIQIKKITGASHAVFHEYKDEFFVTLLDFTSKSLPASSTTKSSCLLGLTLLCISIS
ncbi:hypothetical protein D9619_012479 [Psilocybe cf. subviscida]|uniref:AB hydrolase-1 domain-containing protein n=1 Tax=Psilocybe cf. subviscida TaxID=2480587 RepID=A0A8H5ARA4_9AGAR|nr:hypothetical protein D9619_012479 [Psilocybe cf. subviscida]